MATTIAKRLSPTTFEISDDDIARVTTPPCTESFACCAAAAPRIGDSTAPQIAFAVCHPMMARIVTITLHPADAGAAVGISFMLVCAFDGHLNYILLVLSQTVSVAEKQCYGAAALYQCFPVG